MELNLEKKQLMVDHLKQMISIRSEEIKQMIRSVEQSRNTETKSSAGDKFETGRAMMQLEIDKYNLQLSQNLSLLADLSKINLTKSHQQVELGSLLKTHAGIYFISIGLGIVEISKTKIFCISLASPIGKLLFQKKENESIFFNSKQHTILELC